MRVTDMHKYKVGDTVTIIRCDVRPDLINKITKIKRTHVINNRPAYDLFITNDIIFFEDSIVKKTLTNFEYHAKEIQAIIATNNTFALSGGKIVKCCGLSCNNCEFYSTDIMCEAQKTKWLYEEAKLKKEIALSEKERKLLEILPEKYKYIARDRSGSLYAYVDEPYKAKHCPAWRETDLKQAFNLSPFEELPFEFVEWKDDEPYKISDLLAIPKVK